MEGQNLEIRRFLHKYESVVEGQRQVIRSRRQAVLVGETRCSSELERLVSLTTIDELWSDHLAAITELREGIQWISWGGRDPLHEYLTRVHELFEELQRAIDAEIAVRVQEAETGRLDPAQRGATWTYLTTDQPFGSWTERIMKGVMRKLRSRNTFG